MTRVAIYARYSSDQQRDASIEDQIRLCKERADREGWTIANCYTDHAISGASLMRPGVQMLMRDGATGAFDIVVAESLDRLSRDQEDIAGIYKRLQFADVKILTLSEGEISNLHIGLKGTMNAMFLKDLADKTRRGIRGRVEQGKSGGGNSYGYQVVKEFDGNGDAVRGARAIDEDQAHIVRRIFDEYLSGKSPKMIAHTLNSEGVAGPNNGAWGPSTIYGNWRRGTGVLNNELYVGKLVWNKLRYIKDPDTGKRVSRLNPENEWIINDVPELRIIDQETWDAVKNRQNQQRSEHKSFRDKTRPKNLLSKLMKCGCCGGGFSKISSTHIGCSTSRNKGLSICDNRRAIKQETVERIVVSVLQNELMEPRLIDEFCEEYTRSINAMRLERNASRVRVQSELDKLARQEKRMIQAVMDGFSNDELKQALNSMDARKAELRAKLEYTEEAPTLLHPAMASRYREEVKALASALRDSERRQEAALLVRDLIDKIVLSPDPNGDGLLIDLYGDLPGILNLAKSGGGGQGSRYSEKEIKMIRLVSSQKRQEAEAKSSSDHTDNSQQVEMVAGVYNHLNLRSITTPQVEAAASPRNQFYAKPAAKRKTGAPFSEAPVALVMGSTTRGPRRCSRAGSSRLGASCNVSNHREPVSVVSQA